MGNVLELKQGRFRLDARENVFYCEGDEALEEVAQRACGLPIAGGVQGQPQWGPEQPGLVQGVPCPWQGVWKWMIFKVPSNPQHSVTQ